jgi:hypothetical protein
MTKLDLYGIQEFVNKYPYLYSISKIYKNKIIFSSKKKMHTLIVASYAPLIKSADERNFNDQIPFV